MEENSELEEGEACTYNKDDDDNNIDPDVALSYIDEKIQHVLGHFQKDFEGGVSAENLGAKFGGYGSFLPAYERSSSIFSHPKNPEKCSSTPKSPSHFCVEGVKQSLMIPSRSTPSVRKNVSCESGPAVTFSVKQDSRSSAAPVAQRSTSKDENLNKLSNLSDHRPLKVRIKVGPDKLVRTNTAIYSGLGLDNSPSSSVGNSLNESGGMMPVLEILADESPASILQVMTSLPIPGGVPMSPLQESLLCLVRKERLSGDGKPVEANQEHSSLLAHESAAVLGNVKLSKEEAKPLERSRNVIELRKEHDKNFDNGAELPARKNLETDGLDDKYILSDNLKNANLSSTTGFEKASGGASEVSREANEDGMRGRISSPDMWKEDSLESKSGQGCGKTERRNARSSSVEKLLTGRALTSNNDVFEPKGSGRGKSAKLSVLSKAYSNAFKWKQDLNAEPLAPSEEKVGEQTSFWVQDQFTTPSGNNKPLLQGKKKLKGIEDKKREVDVSKVERSSYDASNGSAKRQKLNSRKDINKVGDYHKSLAKRPIGHRAKDTSIDDDLEMGQLASLQKSKERFHGKGFANQQLQAASCVPQDALLSEVVPAPGVLIEENWVMCDKCEQWRLLPYGTTPDDLPEKWLCSMLNWLPGMNHCDISEEETTQALRAMHQIPVDFVQKNMHTNDYASVSGVTSLDVQHPGHNHHGLSSRTSSSRGKKKYVVNETTKAGTSHGMVCTSKNHSQESVKSKSINEVNQPPAELNSVDKSGFVRKSKSRNVDAEKHMAKHKESHINGGEAKQLKIKSKREAGHCGSKTPKRDRKEDIDHAFKQGNSDMDLGMTSLSSKCDFLMQAGGKNMCNSIDYSLLEDVKGDMKERLLVSVKKVGEEAPILSDGGSLDLRIGEKRDKKRKLKEWPENLIGHETDEIGMKKQRKSRVSKSVLKESSMDGACDKMGNKASVGKILFPGGNHRIVDGVEDFRDMVEDKQSVRHRRKPISQRTLQGSDSLRKDSGAQHVPLTATSSTSKVSCSLKARPTLNEVKSSPVESVSSSPLRTSVPEKFTSSGSDILGKDGSASGGPLANDKPRSCWDGEGGGEIIRSMTSRKEKISGGCHSEYLEWFHLDHRGGEVNQKGGRKSKPLSGDSEMPEHCHDNTGGERTHETISKSDFHMDQKKVDPLGENGDLYSKKKTRYVGETDSKSYAPSDKLLSIVKHNVPDKSSPNFKGEKDHSPSGVSVVCLMDRKSDNQVKLETHDDSDAKIGVLCHSKYNASIQQNLGLDEGKPPETKSGMLKLLSHSEVLGKQENGRTEAGPQQGDAFDGDSHDLVKVRHPENVGSKSGARQSLGHRAPCPVEARDLNASNQMAADILKEAKTLRDRADHFKDSGFAFESNELYFQAALKFLHGASLLDTCSSEISGKGEMTQTQVFNAAAKLCECCALEYERRQDMAAAALAYKCMEVAYWRVVYCKNSSSTRDRNELLASLQMVPQGGSPSSSASDVDNLNNQGTIDKAIVTKGAVSHVAGAQNHLHFLRLLDFTQDVNFALEALRKSQSAFLAANVAAEKAQNRECLSSVKKVIDFSFQDTEGLIHLVQLATKAVSRSGLSGVKG